MPEVAPNEKEVLEVLELTAMRPTFMERVLREEVIRLRALQSKKEDHQ